MMASATADNLDTTAAGSDYGQALAEGEITRLLKTVQAAQFKKSETIAQAEDTSFKPRSLVEIAFAAEQKRQQAEQAAREAEQAAVQARAADEQDPAGLMPEAAAEPQLGDAAEQGDAGPQTTGPADQLPASAAAAQDEEEALRQQREQEDEALRIAAEEQGYKRGFEAGLDAARTAEPTEEELALQAEKEAEKQAVVKQFYDAIAAMAGPHALDSTALVKAIDAAVCQLASERAGLAIAENPEGLLRRIRQLVDKVNAASHRVEVFVNQSDLAVMDSWMREHDAPQGWQFMADDQLDHGDIRLVMGGIEISDVLNPQNAATAQDQPEDTRKPDEAEPAADTGSQTEPEPVHEQAQAQDEEPSSELNQAKDTDRAEPLAEDRPVDEPADEPAEELVADPVSDSTAETMAGPAADTDAARASDTDTDPDTDKDTETNNPSEEIQE